jgi:hydrogenase maturation protease
VTRDTPPIPPPILVLALGNLLLRDDGVGRVLLDELRPAYEVDQRVELLDGGTQGLALLDRLTGRCALLILDAVALGRAPGTVNAVTDALATAPPRGAGAHEQNAGELLAAATLLGECPRVVSVVGIEPQEVRTGVGLSPAVLEAVPDAVGIATRVLDTMIERVETIEDSACTS